MEIGTAAQWASATATFVAVLVALFREDLRSRWPKPILEIEASLNPPGCHKTTVQFVSGPQVLGSAACYYLRLWVRNIGRVRAEKVQVFFAALSRQRADGSFANVESFLPMNLRWAHATPPEAFADGIAPGMGKYCDLGHVLDPASAAPQGSTTGSVVFELDLEVAPNTGSHLLQPGVYRATLQVAGANARPVTRYLELTIRGPWYADESKMFAEGLGMRLVASAG